MTLFCLPLPPNPERAVSKVEQKLKKSEKCSTTGSKFGPATSKVDKISKSNVLTVIEQVMSSTAFGKITTVYGHIDENGRFVRKIWVKSWRIAQKRKNTRHHGTYFKCYSVAYGVMSARFHTFIIRFQTSNKAHDKFVSRRDCACADHSRPSLSTALLSGWSSHLVLIGFKLAFPLSQARTP